MDLMESILKLPLEAAEFDPFETDRQKLLALVLKMKKEPVEFARTPSGGLMARYPVLDLNQFEDFRKEIVSLIFSEILKEQKNRLTGKLRQ